MDAVEISKTTTDLWMVTALDDYIRKHKLFIVPTIENIGVTVPACPDGSCGYSAFILGGWYV